MKPCPNCRCQVNEDASFCPVCGTTLDTVPILPNHHEQIPSDPPVYLPPEPVFDSYDHTEEFNAEDIAETKLVCMIVYLLHFVGVIIALLMYKESTYVQFHIRQSLRITVAEVLLTLLSLVLCWSFVVPILGAIGLIVLMVIRFVSFTQVCTGKAKEPALIRSIAFLK